MIHIIKKSLNELKEEASLYDQFTYEDLIEWANTSELIELPNYPDIHTKEQKDIYGYCYIRTLDGLAILPYFVEIVDEEYKKVFLIDEIKLLDKKDKGYLHVLRVLFEQQIENISELMKSC